MFLGRVERQCRVRACPGDFEAMFVRIGRLECEEHYRARRTTITRWLEQCGKQRLIELRWTYVLSCRAAKARQRRDRLSNREMALILAKAFPLLPTDLSGGHDEG